MINEEWLENEDDVSSEQNGETSTWIALADLMTGLMAIFLVMFLIMMTQQGRTRVVIIQSIQKTMKEKNIEVKVDNKTGDISVTDNVLFAQNQAILTPAGKDMLQQFIPQYSAAIDALDESQRQQISRIVIEGHTSREGAYMHNMTLSWERANAVVQFVNDMPEFKNKTAFLNMLTPVGRGFIDAENVAQASDRKVMFRFQFNSELYENLNNPELMMRMNAVGKSAS